MESSIGPQQQAAHPPSGHGDPTGAVPADGSSHGVSSSRTAEASANGKATVTVAVGRHRNMAEHDTHPGVGGLECMTSTSAGSTCTSDSPVRREGPSGDTPDELVPRRLGDAGCR